MTRHYYIGKAAPPSVIHLMSILFVISDTRTSSFLYYQYWERGVVKYTNYGHSGMWSVGDLFIVLLQPYLLILHVSAIKPVCRHGVIGLWFVKKA